MINKITPISKLDDIPDYAYNGYIWESDQDKPIILNNQTHDFSQTKLNPFIIEAYLYAGQNRQSIAIKHIDGDYFISKIDLTDFDLENLPEDEFTTHTYLTDPAIFNQNKNFKYINFIEYFSPDKDELCLNLNVLTPAWIAFTGFSKEEPK